MFYHIRIIIMHIDFKFRMFMYESFLSPLFLVLITNNIYIFRSVEKHVKSFAMQFLPCTTQIKRPLFQRATIWNDIQQ